MDTLSSVPDRGSLQDVVVTGVYARRRRIEHAKQVYLGRLIASGLHIKENVFRLASELLQMDMNMVSSKAVKKRVHQKLATMFNANSEENQRYFRRLRSLEVPDHDLRPATPEELEQRRRALAARRRAKPPTAQ